MRIDWDHLDTHDFRASWVVVGMECYAELAIAAFEHLAWASVFFSLTVMWVVSLFAIMGLRDLRRPSLGGDDEP